MTGLEPAFPVSKAGALSIRPHGLILVNCSTVGPWERHLANVVAIERVSFKAQSIRPHGLVWGKDRVCMS